MENTINEE
jgi:hypothetical protein